MTLWLGNGAVLKGGDLDFSHLAELINIHITKIHMKNNTNHQELRIKKITKIFF